MRRVPETSSPGSSTIAVSSVPTACRNALGDDAGVDAGRPDDRGVRRDQRDQQPGGEHDRRPRPRPAIAAATIPGSARRSRSRPVSSPACASTRPIRSASASRGRAGRRRGRRRRGGGSRAGAAVGRRRAGGRRPVGGGGWRRVGGGGAAAGRPRASPGAGRRRRRPAGDAELVLARAAGGAEPRAGADALAAVGAEDGVGHALASCLRRAQWVSLAADGVGAAPVKVLIISDMEGVAGICRWEQVSAGKSGYEEGRRLYTEELNAAVRGAFAGGATEVVVMDCHGAGGDWSFNSLIPEALDAALRVRRAARVDRVHRDARAGLRRRAVRRPARPRGRRARRALAHGQLDPLAQPALQRHARRRGRHQRRAVRHLGHAGRARHRRRRRLRRVGRAARPGPEDARGQARPRPLQRPPPLPRHGARAARGRRPRRARATSRAPRSTTPGRPARSRSSSRPQITPTSTATAPA